MRRVAIMLLSSVAVSGMLIYWHFPMSAPSAIPHVADPPGEPATAPPLQLVNPPGAPDTASPLEVSDVRDMSGGTIAANEEFVTDRGNVVVYRCQGCSTGFRVDNPYETLPLDALEQLAVHDPTAAFQAAIRYENLATRSEGNQREELQRSADEFALRSIALSPSSDFSWYFAGAIEHLGLQSRSDWSGVPDERLSRAYKWQKAAEKLGVQDAAATSLAREELLARDLDLALAESAAAEHAAKLRNLRMTLTGLDTQ